MKVNNLLKLFEVSEGGKENIFSFPPYIIKVLKIAKYRLKTFTAVKSFKTTYKDIESKLGKSSDLGELNKYKIAIWNILIKNKTTNEMFPVAIECQEAFTDKNANLEWMIYDKGFGAEVIYNFLKTKPKNKKIKTSVTTKPKVDID